jgi:CO dehydrogenase maturation factor
VVLAVSGKGGTGKTTVAALIVRYLTRAHEVPLLAVDADPNSTLADKLGLRVERTIGDLREDALKSKYDAPAGTPRQQTIEYQVQQAVAEGKGFDVLTMGRGEGPGCYCSVNNMLRTFLSDLSSGYRHVVIDNEAGIEHLSRRTDDKVDVMLVVGDTTPAGLRSAQRIAELATALDLVRGRIWLVLNRVDGAAQAAGEASAATGLPLLGCVPVDDRVQDFEMRGEPLLGMSEDCPAVVAINQIMQSIRKET